MIKLPLTVTIIARNEGDRIRQAIESVRSIASEVIVVDSESTDQTVSIAQAAGAKVVVHRFPGFGQQKNFAQSLATQEWVLNIDADERVSPELAAEITDAIQNRNVSGYFIPRKTWYFNRWVMHGGWYPNYLTRLARKSKARWSEPPIHEELMIEGPVNRLKNPLQHLSFPSQRSHILKNVEYAEHGCRTLIEKGKHGSIFSLVFRPIWKFLDSYLIKAGFLDGLAGFLIAVHSAYATFLRYAYLIEREKSRKVE